MASFLNFLLRWRTISKRYPRLGTFYFWSFFVIPITFVLAAASGWFYSQSNQSQYLILFYIFIGICIIAIVAVFLIEMYVFLSWLKRVFS